MVPSLRLTNFDLPMEAGVFYQESLLLIKRHQIASAGDGAVSSAADKMIDTTADAAALTPLSSQDLLVGASCAECGNYCGATSYWTPAVASNVSLKAAFLAF